MMGYDEKGCKLLRPNSQVKLLPLRAIALSFSQTFVG